MSQVSASSSIGRWSPPIVLRGGYQRVNAHDLGHGLRGWMVLELADAVFRDAHHLWELHLSGSASGRGVPP